MRGGVALAVLSVLGLTASLRADTGAEHVRVDLLADTTAVGAGKPFTVGVRFRIDPGWHIYWTNPGDSGLPTRVKLDLPPGFQAAATEYPVPSILRFPGDITNYGYEDSVVLLVPVTPSGQMPGAVHLKATADFLVCKDVCLPGRVVESLELPVNRPAGPGPDADIIKQWTARLPRVGDDHMATYQQVVPQQPAPDGSVQDWVTVHWNKTPPHVAWIPPALDGFEFDNTKVVTAGATTRISFVIRRLDPKADPPAAIEGLLVYSGADGMPAGDQLKLTYLAGGREPAPWGFYPGR